MGIFDWLTAPKAVLLYTDNKGQHRLTAEQYGEKCVNWAVGMGRLKSQHLVAFGKVRNTPDVIAKISQIPFIATAHGTAFFVAVYSTYPVIRLGISNELFKGIVQGVNNTILDGGYLFNSEPNTPEYLKQLAVEVSQYAAILLETAGMANQQNQDRMMYGIGGAIHRLITVLDHEYADVVVPQNSEERDDAPTSTTTQSSDDNSGNGSFKIPSIEAMQSIAAASNTEIVYTDTSSEVIDPITEDDIVKWFDVDVRLMLLAALAKRLGIDEKGTPADYQRVEQIADQQRDDLKTILSSNEPVMIEERVKNALKWALEVTDRGDNMTTRLREKLIKIPCSLPKPIPKVLSHSPYVESMRGKDSKTVLLATFANAATEYVKETDDRKILVLLVGQSGQSGTDRHLNVR